MQPQQEWGLLYVAWISYLGAELIKLQPLLSSLSLICAIGASSSVILWNCIKVVNKLRNKD